MDSQSLEQTLRNLAEIGTLVKDRKYRQVWRFEHDGKPYYLKFYPTGGYRDRFRRFFRGSPAMYEFVRLQWLQKAGIPAPRAASALMGFPIGDQTGDAVILEAIEPSVPLDQILIEAELLGEPVPNHLHLANQVRSIVQQLGRAKLGHEDLHLGNFLLKDGKLFLLDAYAVRAGGMRLRDILMLGHSARRFCTTADLLRGWREFSGDEPGSIPLLKNSLSQMLWKRAAQSTGRENRYFGRCLDGDWAGLFYKRTKYGHRWSQISRLEITPEDWTREWPLLLAKVEADQLPVIKRSRSGDVLSAQVTLGGELLDVIVKRPRRRYWYRYLNEIGRGSRARRAWNKAWNMITRGVPAAWPVLVMEKRSLGYVVDAIFVSERVSGETLAHADLDGIATGARDLLFRRTGHLLRLIERLGFSHFDAKASNWIVLDDPQRGPMPIMIDVDGIRRRNWIALGIQRLLRSMHENPHYVPGDSLSLCQGYAPYARFGEIAPEDPGHADAELKIVES